MVGAAQAARQSVDLQTAQYQTKEADALLADLRRQIAALTSGLEDKKAKLDEAQAASIVVRQHIEDDYCQLASKCMALERNLTKLTQTNDSSLQAIPQTTDHSPARSRLNGGIAEAMQSLDRRTAAGSQVAARVAALENRTDAALMRAQAAEARAAGLGSQLQAVANEQEQMAAYKQRLEVQVTAMQQDERRLQDYFKEASLRLQAAQDIRRQPPEERDVVAGQLGAAAAGSPPVELESLCRYTHS